MESSTPAVTPPLSGLQAFSSGLVAPLAPSIMGGGDHVRFSTPTTVPRARGRALLSHSTPYERAPRPLRRASPAPRPLWEYSTPPRQQREELLLVCTSPAGHTGGSNDEHWVSHLPSSPLLVSSNEQGHSAGEVSKDVDLTPERVPSVTLETHEPALPFLGPEGDPRELLEEFQYEFMPEPSFSSVGNGFLASCDIPLFNPERPTFTPFDVLLRFGYVFGDGVTKSELKRVFRKCRLCDNVLYSERRSHHRCEGDVVNTQEEDFDLIQALTVMEENAGMRPADLTRLLIKCNNCRRFCTTTMSRYHRCLHRDVVTIRV